MHDNTIQNILKAQASDKQALEQLVGDNKGLIWNIVMRFRGRGYEIEDLYQIGCMGFIKAIKRFDTSFDVKLSTYTVPYILGEIKRHLRDDGPIKVSRSIKELSIKIRDIKEEYLIKQGKEITIKELEEILNVEKEEIALAIEALNPVESIYNPIYQEKDKEISLIDKLSLNIDEATNIVNKITIKNEIKKLDQREQEIIMLRYYKEKTQTQVAKILGITQVQVSRLEKKILNTLKHNLTKNA